MSIPRPTPEKETLWFYTNAQNQPVGPVSLSELQRLAAAGVVAPDIHVIEEGGAEWKTFDSVILKSDALPLPPVSAPLRKTPPRRWPAILALVLFYPVGLVLLLRTRAFKPKTKKILAAMFFPLFLIAVFLPNSCRHSEPKTAALGQGSFVMAGTTLYADEETLRTIKTEWDKGESAGNEASERLRRSGKIWTEELHIATTVLREGGPMDSVFVEAKEPRGLRASRFWVLKPLIPIDRPFAQRAIRKEFMRRKSDFVFTFTGNNGTEVNGADVGNLADMIEGIYGGQIPSRVASRYLFRMEAIEAELVRVTSDYLIYETVVHPRKHYQFAMRRDPAFERELLKNYGSLDEFYEDIRRSQFHSDNPLTQGPVMVVGTKQFTTGAGLVKVVPVVQVVNLIP